MHPSDMLRVLTETRDLLARTPNDYSWSSWKDRDAAVREMDSFVRRINAGDDVDMSTLAALYAPTGPLQEVSLSSGWGDVFLRLADRFDAAERKMKRFGRS